MIKKFPKFWTRFSLTEGKKIDFFGGKYFIFANNFLFPDYTDQFHNQILGYSIDMG